LPSRPLRRAGFAVLRGPEVASLLIELGFMSSAEDRARLTDPVRRARVAQVLAQALDDWARAPGGPLAATNSR
jgi:N-acetylmuramoyl-L-alanine amidase